MSILGDQLREILRPGMSVPEPLDRLYEWIEARGYVYQSEGRLPYGSLCDLDAVYAAEAEGPRPGGTLILFSASFDEGIDDWFASDGASMAKRLAVFARTGADGSLAALWLDRDGTQKIVHLGSGSGSLLTCVLAEDAVDLLRLLAIGYDEICWDEEFGEPPSTTGPDGVEPNAEFQGWVRQTFDVDIPGTAREILPDSASSDEDASKSDPFLAWIESRELS